MTTLAQGSSVTLSVGDGGSVSIATNGGTGSASFTPTGASAYTVSLGPQPERRKFGPFSEGASVTLTNSTIGVFDYDASGAAQFTNDAASAIVSLAVGGDGLKAALRSAWLARRAMVRASITPVANTGTVRYIDPSATNNGDGTAPYPAAGSGLTGAYNTPPTLNGANTTYLFAENTTYVGALSLGASGIVLGTYEQTTGARVFDAGRLATIDANGSQNGISRSGAFTGWAVSGLRIKNVRHATAARGIYLIGDNCTAEFNVIEDVLPSSSPTTSCGIQASGANQVIRFNTIRCTNCDLIQVSVNGTVMPFNPHVYCNDLRVVLADQDGPDCIQFYTDTSNANTSGFKSFEITNNWCESENSNQKQGIIVQDICNSTLAGLIAGNVIWGCDIGTKALLNANQKGIELQSPNVRVWANFVRNGDFGINVNNAGCDVRGNVILQESTPGATSGSYYGISMAQTGGLCEHNTVIATSALTTGRGLNFTSTFAGSIKRNIVFGTWPSGMRSNSATESDNVFFVTGTPVANGSGTALAAGSGTTTAIDPGLTLGMSPRAANAATDSALAGVSEDVFGRPWRGKTGAIQ